MDNIVIKFWDYDKKFIIDIHNSNVIFGSNGIGKTRVLKTIFEAYKLRLDETNYNIEHTNLSIIKVTKKADRNTHQKKELEDIFFNLHILYIDRLKEINSPRSLSSLKEKTIVELSEIKRLNINEQFELLSSVGIEFIQNVYIFLQKYDVFENNDSVVAKILRIWFSNYNFRMFETMRGIDSYNREEEFKYQELRLRYNRVLNRSINYTERKQNISLEKFEKVVLLETSRIIYNEDMDFFENEMHQLIGIDRITKIILSNNLEFSSVEAMLSELRHKIGEINKALLILKSGLEIVIDERITIRKNKKELGYSFLSSGERSLLIMFIVTTFEQNSLILIDEVDLSLTFSWQFQILELLDVLNENNTFLLTSHSPLVYNGVENDDSKFKLLDFE